MRRARRNDAAHRNGSLHFRKTVERSADLKELHKCLWFAETYISSLIFDHGIIFILHLTSAEYFFRDCTIMNRNKTNENFTRIFYFSTTQKGVFGIYAAFIITREY